MARYINEEEFVAWVKEHWCSDCNNDNGLRCRACWIDDAIDIVEEAPPADVVPSSEFEQLKRNLEECETGYEGTLFLERCKLADAERKVMEIFEEIETCMKDFEDDDDGYILKKCEFEFFMRELKKKCTEEK